MDGNSLWSCARATDVIGTSKRRAKEKQSLRAKKKGRRHIQSAHRKTQRLFSPLLLLRQNTKNRGHHTKVVVGPIIMSCYLSIGGCIEIFFERIIISYIPGGCCERPAGLDYRTTCWIVYRPSWVDAIWKNESLVIQSVRLMALKEKKDTSQYSLWKFRSFFEKNKIRRWSEPKVKTKQIGNSCFLPNEFEK